MTDILQRLCIAMLKGQEPSEARIATAALIALESAADLPRGKSLIIHGENYGLTRDLYVLRRDHVVDSFFLRLENPTDRQHSRFCDGKAELLEDLEYYFRSGALPYQKAGWF